MVMQVFTRNKCRIQKKILAGRGRTNTPGVTSRGNRRRNAAWRSAFAILMKSTDSMMKPRRVRRPVAVLIAPTRPAHRPVRSATAFPSGWPWWRTGVSSKRRKYRAPRATCPKFAAGSVRRNASAKGPILNARSEPVAIGAVEKFLNEYAFAHHAVDAAVATPNGLKVAVVGAVPVEWRVRTSWRSSATLSPSLKRKAAPADSWSTAFRPSSSRSRSWNGGSISCANAESPSAAGSKSGAISRCRPCGNNLRGYLAIGAQKPKELRIPGVELRGVFDALPFLVQKNVEEAAKSPRSMSEESALPSWGEGTLRWIVCARRFVPARLKRFAFTAATSPTCPAAGANIERRRRGCALHVPDEPDCVVWQRKRRSLRRALCADGVGGNRMLKVGANRERFRAPNSMCQSMWFWSRLASTPCRFLRLAMRTTSRSTHGKAWLSMPTK